MSENTVSAPVDHEGQAVVSTEKKSAPSNEKSGLEMIVEALSNLNFLISSSTEVTLPSGEDLKIMLSGRDELIINEKSRYDQMYKVWYDEPNRKYYIIRDSPHMVKFSDYDGMISALINLFNVRLEASLQYIREPEMVFLRANRVYEPSSLGLPTDGILTNGVASDSFRARLEDVCRPVDVNDGYVRINVLGDKGVIATSSNIISYAISNMGRVRTVREDYMNLVSRLERKEQMTLRPRSSFEFYYPSFDFNMVQGPFDDLNRAPRLRLLFMQTIIMPHVYYVPLSTSDLLKNANVNSTKTGYTLDISSRTFKTEYHDMYSAYVLSLLCPGEVLFDVGFHTGMESSATLKGFAALIARLCLMYDENSVFCNSTMDAQIAIDNALINWGCEMNAIVPTGNGGSAKYPLNGYKLNHASVGDQNTFNYLKIRNGAGGACSNGNIYVKRNDAMREHFPLIAYRANYIVDCDDFNEYENGVCNKHSWRVLQGAEMFLSKIGGGTGYVGLLRAISTRIFESFIRFNEYNRIHWYTSFRMTQDAAARVNLDQMQKRSFRLVLSSDFLLATPKGFCNTEWKPLMRVVDRVRFESSFVRETNRVAYMYRYVFETLQRTGNVRSYSKSRIIALACEQSPLYRFIRQLLYLADSDRRIPNILSRYITESGMGALFLPLLNIDDSFLHMYGMLRRVVVDCRLNSWNKNTIDACISGASILTNRARVSNIRYRYTYADIEQLLRNKSFNSVFANSAISPFELNIYLPYQVVHSTDTLHNATCLQKHVADALGEVAYDKCIRNGSVCLLAASVDRRLYNFPDDYAPSPCVVDSYWIMGAEYDDIVFDAAGFYGTIGSRVGRTIALTRKDYCFISLYR